MSVYEHADVPVLQHAHQRRGQSEQKTIIRIRMIPFDESFAHMQGRTFFGMNDMTVPWMLMIQTIVMCMNAVIMMVIPVMIVQMVVLV